MAEKKSGAEMIDSGKVKSLAYQLKIQLTDEEAELFAKDMSKIISYFDELRKIEMGDVSPTYWITEAVSSLREDIPSDGLQREQVLANATSEGKYVKAPKV
ncbi:MAG: Asp-tRNA(Asn)/Glu-tRNA(Gln) amidotransferase subunit GatC [Thermoprotei archaeon]